LVSSSEGGKTGKTHRGQKQHWEKKFSGKKTLKRKNRIVQKKTLGGKECHGAWLNVTQLNHETRKRTCKGTR